jgi:hypothetical protein
MLALKNVIRNVQGNQEGLTLFETHLLVVFTDYIVLLSEKNKHYTNTVALCFISVTIRGLGI